MLDRLDLVCLGTSAQRGTDLHLPTNTFSNHSQIVTEVNSNCELLEL